MNPETNRSNSRSESRRGQSGAQSQGSSAGQNHEQGYLAQGVDTVKSGASSVGSFLKANPYLVLGISAVAGYFATAALYPMFSKDQDTQPKRQPSSKRQ